MNPFLFPFRMMNETNPRGQVTSLPDARRLPESGLPLHGLHPVGEATPALVSFPLEHLPGAEKSQTMKQEQGSLRDAEAHGRTEMWTSRAVGGKRPGFRLESRRPTSCMCDLGPLLCFRNVKSMISNSITCQDD